ncbi:MAG: DUF697 domain-containing protein [Bryobacteraceae bacterium]
MKRLAAAVGIGVLFLFALFVFNQTAQAVALANAASPGSGRIVLLALLAIYTAIVAFAVHAFLRLPAPMSPPELATGPAFDQHLKRLSARLEKNPNLANAAARLSDRAGIEDAIRILDARSIEIARRTASAVFVSTAISQNGRLDAIMVLVMQARMLWQIAQVYQQRPALREMWRLYANVGATAFFAAQIEDLDIADQVQPVIQAALGSSVIGMVPGVSHVSSIVIQSLLEGSANAYLTLRVAVIGQRYCGAVVAVDPVAARKFASVTAAQMLGSLVAASAGAVVKSILSAAKKAGESKVESATTGIRGVVAKINPFRTEAG